jgi:hypothetical protein
VVIGVGEELADVGERVEPEDVAELPEPVFCAAATFAVAGISA